MRVASSKMQVRKLQRTVDKEYFACVPQMTVYSAVFASPSRVRHTHAHGLRWPYYMFESVAGRGYTELCAYLRAERCDWDDMTCRAATVGGHCTTLRWLREHGCRWDTIYTPIWAAEGGSVDVLAYNQQHGIVFTDEMLTHILKTAVACDHSAAAEWLRQQGAQ
jgi:hypothetical protein